MNSIGVHPTTPKISPNETLLKIHRIYQDCHDDVVLFTNEEVTCAIELAKTSKALGPDDIAPIMLNHLGPVLTEYIAYLINNTLLSLVATTVANAK